MTDQGSVYAAFIDDQMKGELARRTSLDERGAKLQQSASVTVGLFVTALGLLLGTQRPLVGPALWVFVSSVLVLVGAFLCGIVTTRLVTYDVADDDTFQQMLGSDHWSDTEVTSRNITAFVNAKTVAAMRPGNNFKAAWLSYGIIAQGIGVLLGGIAFVMVATGTLVGDGIAPSASPQPSPSAAAAASPTATP